MMNLTHEINNNLLIALLVVFTFIAGGFPKSAAARPVDEAYGAVADRLAGLQSPDGSWIDEQSFTGSIVAGLTRAYEVTGKADYLRAAEQGVGYIVDVAGGNYFGDEAYAMARLGEVAAEPAYADIVLEFYNGLDTAAYINGFQETDRSNAVFYMSHHAIAAHKVDARDAQMWRDALIDYLCMIDDDLAYYPVMSLGLATWALAQTGPMDDTLMDPNGEGEIFWSDVRLSDLPGILVTHLDDSGEYKHSFYYRFDHRPAGLEFEASGYTEDTLYGLCGLIAADAAGWDFDQEINDVRQALADSVSHGGIVWAHLFLKYGISPTGHVYAGELLETMPVEDQVEEAAVLSDDAASQDN